MRELVGRGARLIVTVDCGTNSAPSIDAALRAGAEVVVLDHHQVGGPLPVAVAVVNPNREDDLSGQGHLCAAGVVFLALVQTARLLRIERPDAEQPDLLAMLDLVALATVCDVVPLTGVNRAFVVKGLLAVRQQRNAGLAALARVSRIGEPINTFHLSFLIGPRINAGGRIGDAALGSRLLATDDPVEAGQIAETLDRLNQERQAMEQDMLAEARAEADAELAGGAGPAIVVTASQNWHPGIVGLLASRLKEHARRPAFAIAFNPNGVGTGSGRSVAGFDLGRLVRDAAGRGADRQGRRPRHGGRHHGRARQARRTCAPSSRSAPRRRCSDCRTRRCWRSTPRLPPKARRSALLDALEKAGPFGAGHVAPVFVLPRHRLEDARLVGANHVRADLRSDGGGRIQAMAFRAADTALGDFLFGNRGATVHVAGSLSGNYWNGNRKVQFRIIDAALST